jgi:hypothetical protein
MDASWIAEKIGITEKDIFRGGRMMSNARFDEEKATVLYMAGMLDGEIGKSVGVNSQSICLWRERNDLPHNKKLFDWQKKYQGEIPEKYRDPRGI